MHRALVLVLALLLCGCSTTVYGPTGQPQLRTYANASRLTFTGPGTSLRVEGLDHSGPTRAAGSVLGTGMTGLGGVLTSGAATGLFRTGMFRH